MPLRDRDRRRIRRLARLGIIRLGHKATKTVKRQGRDVEVTYPVADTTFQLHDAPDLLERFGPTARELPIMFPLPDPADNFDGFYNIWAGGILVCKGDGELVQFAGPHTVGQTPKGRTVVKNARGDTLVTDGTARTEFTWAGDTFAPGDFVPCSGAAQDLYPHCPACVRSSILKVMIDDPEVFRFGYYQLATGSGRNYDHILGTLETVHDQAGRVNGIPFTLRLVEEATVYRENGQAHATRKWFLQLEPEPAYTRAAYQRRATQAIGLPEPEPPIEEIAGELLELEEPAPPTAAEADPPEEVQAGDPITPAPEPDRHAAHRRLGHKFRNAYRAKLGTQDAPATTDPASDRQAGLLAAKLNECFAPETGATADRSRRLALAWITGRDSVKDITRAQANPLLDLLLDPRADDGTYDLRPRAAAALQDCRRLALIESGQQELPLAAPEEEPSET